MKRAIAMSLSVGILLTLASHAVAQDSPFQTITFDKALAQAKKSDKVVMIDFYTTWCVPCKQLDNTTWKDDSVVKWLRQQTVALKIDAEKEPKLASRYRVNAYPSMVFVAPDGKEKGRIIGYRDAQRFLKEANDALKGISLLEGLRKQLAADANNPRLRSQLGNELARLGRYKEALVEYLWCFDHGVEYQRGYAGVRTSFLLGDITRLGRAYPPALAELRKRRDRARDALLSNQNVSDSASDFAAINHNLGEDDRTLAFYDTLDPADETPRSARQAMFRKVLDLLLKSKRYEDVLAGVGDIDDAVGRRMETYRLAVARFKGDDRTLAQSLKRSAVKNAGKYYEALLGVNREEEAQRLARRLIDFDKSGATYATLIRHAGRAGAADTARTMAKTGKESLRPDQHKEVDDAVGQLP